LDLREFEQAVLRHQHRVFGYAVRMLRDREGAADVVQDSMLKLWSHRVGVQPEGALAWLLRVTRNGCIDALRRRRFEQDHFPAEADTEALPGGGSETDRAAASGILRPHLERCLDRLDEPYRSILILREIEDFRYDEISGALDLPITSVKVYLHRARKKLRMIIEEELHGELV
jgi:RNA polymerase sigma-70 factor (ECF subfamily)